MHHPTFLVGQPHRSELEPYLDNLAWEGERHLIVFVVDRRAGIHADVKRLVDGHKERDGVRDLSAGDFGVVHLQDACATLAETRAIVGEVEHDGVLAGGKRLLAFPPESLQT